MSVNVLVHAAKTVSLRVINCKAEVQNGLPAFEQLLEKVITKRCDNARHCLVEHVGRKGVKGGPLLQMQQGLSFGVSSLSIGQE